MQWVEQLKREKERLKKKTLIQKEKVAYVECEELEEDDSDLDEVHVAEKVHLMFVYH